MTPLALCTAKWVFPKSKKLNTVYSSFKLGQTLRTTYQLKSPPKRSEEIQEVTTSVAAAKKISSSCTFIRPWWHLHIKKMNKGLRWRNMFSFYYQPALARVQFSTAAHHTSHHRGQSSTANVAPHTFKKPRTVATRLNWQLKVWSAHLNLPGFASPFLFPFRAPYQMWDKSKII